MDKLFVSIVQTVIGKNGVASKLARLSNSCVQNTISTKLLLQQIVLKALQPNGWRYPEYRQGGPHN